MCHAALNYAVRYCFVEQAVLGARILTEPIWILSSNCLNALIRLTSSSKENGVTEEESFQDPNQLHDAVPRVPPHCAAMRLRCPVMLRCANTR